MRLRVFICAWLFIFLFSSIGSTRTQSPAGMLNGIVTDPTGAAIVGAEILVVNDLTRVQYPARTDSDGIYVVSNLPPGTTRPGTVWTSKVDHLSVNAPNRPATTTQENKKSLIDRKSV